MKEDKPYGKFTIEKLRELAEEIFKERPFKNRWYESLPPQQRESVDKIFKAEVEKQLEQLEESFRNDTYGGTSIEEENSEE